MSAEDYIGIQQLIYRYALAVDNRDSALFTDCFAPGLLTPARVEKIMKWHGKFEYTVHNVLNYVYAVQDRTATGTHYSTVCYVKNTAGKLTKFDVYARYENVELIKGDDDRWRFKKGEWKPIFSTAEGPAVKDVPAGFLDDLK